MRLRGENKVVPIEALSPNPWNPNVQSEFIFEKEIRSLEKHGQLAPVLVRQIGGGFEIIDGEHRYKAMRSLGATEIEVKDLGALSDTDAKQITILMNEIRGEPDEVRLQRLLQDLAQQVDLTELQEAMPYSEEEMKAYLDGVVMDLEANLAEMDVQDSSPATTDKTTGEGAPLSKTGYTMISYHVPKEVGVRFKNLIERLKDETQPGTPRPEAKLTPVFELILSKFETPSE